ncbi:uncharacterized protein LOC122264900 isoform X2 [Penaeus japonicus]|uniref:uncharacterized protein LOC122264900 isoform X2 n=1 Tax=Penaeus japonicus TaxID=27405 RepID=UPI001C71419E|nr:uncharacterized protein LOC122264900 isoform X2 [Penaeus japonicus]
MLPGSVKATLLLLLMLASQEVISQERGRQSSPARASQGDDDSPMSLKAKDDRTQDLLSQKTGREQVPLETPSDEPASRRGGMAGRRATKNTKRLSNRNPKKKEVEKKNKERQDPDRRKQSPGKSNSRKKNVRKRKVEEKETKTKAKKKQRKRQNKTVKKKLKFGKNPTKKNKPVKNKAKKRKSKKHKRRKNRGGAKKPKKGQRKKGKQGVRSNTKKSKPKIKVGRTKPKSRVLFQGGKCGSSTRVGVGEVLAVEASDSGKAVECKHTIRARKGVTLKMTCPRFSLSPGGCKEEKVIIREVGKGKGFKKKYCKSENPGADVSVAAPKAVTFLHERTQQKGKRCSDGFLCLFSATEISGTVSECRKKYKLREGETMIVTPTTFRDKVSCKYSFRSPPGTVLSLRCPSFNLNARGCGRERVIVREKKPKYKEKFCKENNPAAKRGQTASNYVIITHKRKKLKNNECERGFWCQVSAVRGQPVTNKPTVGQPVSDRPSIGHPVTAKPTVGQPVTDQPTMAQPVTVKPTIGQSMTGQSTMVQPVTTKPTVGQSVTDKPTMAQPVTARPTVGQSLTDKPTMGKPVTDKPISPTTNMPPVSTTETDPPTVQQPSTSQIPEVIASTATPSQSIADTPVQQPTTSQIPEVIASTTTPSQSIPDTPGTMTVIINVINE